MVADPLLVEWFYFGPSTFGSTFWIRPGVWDVILRSGTWWDPVRCSFCDALGEPMRGTWIPALSGCLPDLHLISPGAPLAAHVFCLDTRDNRYPLITAHLGGPEAKSPPFGWHWHPSIAATSPAYLRDGDVLVVDPTAARVWDPLAGVPPSIALDMLAAGTAIAFGPRFSFVLSLLFCVSRAYAVIPPAPPPTADVIFLDEAQRAFPTPDSDDHRPPIPASDVTTEMCRLSPVSVSSLGSGLCFSATVHPSSHFAAASLLLFGLVCGSCTRTPTGIFLGVLISTRPSWGVRLESPSFAHRLWQPGDGLQDPVWSREISCPRELQTRFPAWNTPVRVCPAVYGGGWEWIPGSIDPAYASVVLIVPPKPRAALLPSVCIADLLLRSLRLQLPSLTQVEVTPAAWRGTRRTSVPTLYLRDGDVVQVRADGWMPMLRAPPAILHCSPHSAARDAFWGLPFRIRDPGMIFAWRPDDPRPLCVPSRRGEAWDPEGCTFRPSLAAFSPERWVPAAIEDPLGLHLMLEGASVVWVHHFLPGFPSRAVCSPRDEVPPHVRDGDVSGALSASASLAFGVVVWALCDNLHQSIFARLCLAGFLSMRYATGVLVAPPVICHTPSHGISALLLEVYPLAWGAPSDPSASFQVSLDSSAQIYARLSAHYLARPLRADFPHCAPSARKRAWDNFPAWGTGPPEELCIATDGSGHDHGGWAFAVWALWRGQWYRCGWDGGACHLTPWLLPETPSASDLRSYLGELGALTSAALWLSAWWDCLKVSTSTAPTRVTIAVDNIAALGVAAGRATPSHPQAQVCRGVWQAVQSRLSTDFRHVPGHCGVLVNEIADFLAGYTAIHPRAASVGYARLSAQIARDLARASSQLWLLPTAQLIDGQLVWCPPPVVHATSAPAACPSETPNGPNDEPAAVPAARAKHRLKLVQANVQTMSDVEPTFFNRSGHDQRRIHLSRQLHDLGVHIAFLQECRSRIGRWASHGYLSWRSGHSKGCYGVEIWVDPDCVTPSLKLDDWRICISQPRLLVIRCLREDLPLTLVSAHAPHAERPLEEIRTFWRLLQEQLRVIRRDGPLLVGLDANADFLAADEQEALVGPLLASRLPRPGDDFLLQTVVEAGLCAVGTWPEIHHGPTWTWQHTSGKRQRLDHFLLSQDVRVDSHSQCPGFDIITREARDHMPLACYASISSCVARRPQSLTRYPADRASEVGSAIWQHLLPQPGLRPSQQLQAFLSAHTVAVKGLPKRPPFTRRQPYISDEAAEVLVDLRDARAESRRLRAHLDHFTCQACLRAWRGLVARADHRLGIHLLRLQIQLHSADILRLKTQAHILARRDKQQYFSQLLEEATAHWHATGRPLESTQRLSWASKTAKQKRDVKAASGYDIDLELQAQFQNQEAGRTVSSSQLHACFSVWEVTPKPPCIEAAPTLLDLEALCRAQKPRKAPGPDAIRNEVWRVRPESAGRWLWPLCSCICFGQREPLHFKDSSVCALHKKGPAYLPSNFRSIAMLNGVAKLWHSHVRATVGQDVLRQYFPTQLGGRRGIDTSMALGVLRCVCDLAHGQGRSWAAFFVDIQAAYYETSRSLLFDGPGPDPALEALQLPAHVQALISEGALQGLAIPPEHIALLQDCVECSFWTFTGQTQQVMATRGSRPGDGLADVLFGALFAVILSCLEAKCQQHGLVHRSMSDALGVPDKPLQIAWADDLSLVVDFQSAKTALDLLPQLATLILQVIEAFRFRVNLGEGKTEALVHLCGTGASAAKKQFLSGTPGITAADGRVIRVVAEYKYLGVPQRTNDNGRRDIEAAAIRGRGVWSQAASLIHSPALPWPLKLAWFQGRTLPAAFSSLATTLAVSSRALSPLTGFFEQCLRQLASTWDDGHHASSDTLKVCIHAPDVEVSLCIARVRLLCRILQHRSVAVADLFAAAWDRDGRWAGLMCQAVRQLWPATSLPPLRSGEPTLAAIARHSKCLLVACKRVSRHGTLLQALCRTWSLFGQGTPRHVIGRALTATQSFRPNTHLPRTCTACTVESHYVLSTLLVRCVSGVCRIFIILTACGTTFYTRPSVSTVFGV